MEKIICILHGRRKSDLSFRAVFNDVLNKRIDSLAVRLSAFLPYSGRNIQIGNDSRTNGIIQIMIRTIVASQVSSGEPYV